MTGALKAGTNRLEIKVTNLWPNRMIGDLQPSAAKRYTFTDFKPYTKDSPLVESGLLGPVTLSSVTAHQPVFSSTNRGEGSSTSPCPN